MPVRSQLWGLVLAGGYGARLGTDKGALDFHGEPQARWAHRLLEAACGRTYVSVRADQAPLPCYAGLPLIFDAEPSLGPASGLLAAWSRHPDAAWLVLAVDLPLVEAAMLRTLLDARDANAAATVFRNADAVLEPLCAIWETAACAPLRRRIAEGDASLRRLLEAERVNVIAPPEPHRLRSVNRAAEVLEVRSILARQV